MNKKKAIVMAIVAMTCLAGWCSHGASHRLAGDIALGLGLALGGARTTYVAPAPVVVSTPAPVVVSTPAPVVVSTPAPVVATPVVTAPVVTEPVVTTTIPSYGYGYYNDVYCPTYCGYYYYNNAWVWGGGLGYRPPVPTWIPPHRPMMPHPIRRPAPMPLRPAHRPMAPGRPGGAARPPMSPHHFR